MRVLLQLNNASIMWGSWKQDKVISDALPKLPVRSCVHICPGAGQRRAPTTPFRMDGI